MIEAGGSPISIHSHENVLSVQNPFMMAGNQSVLLPQYKENSKVVIPMLIFILYKSLIY
jgi:hypothetical protein